MKRIQSICAAALVSLGCAGAQAQTADARLSAMFRDPVGVVGPADPIEMWITLTSAGSVAMTYDLDASEPFGVPDGYALPLLGQDNSVSGGPPAMHAFASYTNLSAYYFRNCSDTFTATCSPAAYRFNAPSDGMGWFDTPRQFSLAPGASMDIHLYTLTPEGGMAAPGTYVAYNVGVGVTVHGLADDGVTELTADLFSATTCPGLEPGCGFTRTVVAAVPEPTSVAMLLSGLVVLASAGARRRKTAGLRASQA